MFDPELFRTTLANGLINANNAKEEADEVMKKAHAIGILQCTGGITT